MISRIWKRMGRRVMRKVTVALLFGAYLCLALTVALMLWRGGGGEFGRGRRRIDRRAGSLARGPAQLASAGAGKSGALHAEVGAVRDPHRILIDQIQDMHERLAALGESVQEDADRRTESLNTQVRVLEDLVQRMSEDLEERIATSRSAPVAAPSFATGPVPAHAAQQHAALQQTVREALADNRVDLYLQPVVSLPPDGRTGVLRELFAPARRHQSGDDAGGGICERGRARGAWCRRSTTSCCSACVQIVRRLAKNDRKVGIFCNISLGSLGDEAFFPQFLEFLAQNKDMAGALIFELGQPAFERRGSIEALQHGQAGRSGLPLLAGQGHRPRPSTSRTSSRADVKKIAGAQGERPIVLLSQLLEVDGHSLADAVARRTSTRPTSRQP